MVTSKEDSHCNGRVYRVCGSNSFVCYLDSSGNYTRSLSREIAFACFDQYACFAVEEFELVACPNRAVQNGRRISPDAATP